MFLPHTYQTRDFAPALAARVKRPLVTDCVAVKDGGYVRPMFQGKLQADVAVDGPHVATFQIGAYRADAMKAGASAGRDAQGRRRDRRREDPPEARGAVQGSEAGRGSVAGAKLAVSCPATSTFACKGVS